MGHCQGDCVQYQIFYSGNPEPIYRVPKKTFQNQKEPEEPKKSQKEPKRARTKPKEPVKQLLQKFLKDDRVGWTRWHCASSNIGPWEGGGRVTKLIVISSSNLSTSESCTAEGQLVSISIISPPQQHQVSLFGGQCLPRKVAQASVQKLLFDSCSCGNVCTEKKFIEELQIVHLYSNVGTNV